MILHCLLLKLSDYAVKNSGHWNMVYGITKLPIYHIENPF